jgi:sporulation protein YlmC with PRC-barrel domain
MTSNTSNKTTDKQLEPVPTRERVGIVKSGLLIVTVALGALGASRSASAQVVGSTTIGLSVVETRRLTLGWSVKKSVLGMQVYNDTGDKIGKVEDLIISPDRTLSYLIIAAGGFVGIGTHDVAIPATQVQDKAGRLVIPGATKANVKAMPRFDYADDTATRDRFVAEVELDIANGKAKMHELQQKAAMTTAEVKVRLDHQAAGLQKDLTNAEERLSEMNRAAANRWKVFEGGVSAARERLRKSLDALTG